MASHQKPRLLIGLTGGLASGKSTVAKLLRQLGCTVLDADQVVADLYRPGERGAKAVAKLFGEGVLDEEGAVDRPKVAERVFADGDARRRLEEVIHPLVRQRTNELLAQAEGIVVYEATLLVEAGRADAFDLVLTVEAPEEQRLAWAVGRGMDEEAAKARLVAQGDGAHRRERADVILQNDGTLEELTEKVQRLHEGWQARLRGEGNGS